MPDWFRRALIEINKAVATESKLLSSFILAFRYLASPYDRRHLARHSAILQAAGDCRTLACWL